MLASGLTPLLYSRKSELIETLKAWAREPLVHFLIIGAGVYALFGFVAGGESQDDERTVFVSASDISSLTDQWTRTRNRPPTEEELAGIVRAHVRVKVLYREGLAMGLDVGDMAIERRLAQKVEMLARSLITPDDPTDEELKAWYAAHPDAFKQPDEYSIAHIFFDPNKREETTLDDARATREKLNALDEVPADFGDYGDPLMLQNYFERASEFELGRLFGSDFVGEIVGLQPGKWHGPVRSGYGAHLVWISEAILIPAPPFDTVRSQIAERWMAEQIDEMSERFIGELLSRYDVVIDDIGTTP